MSKTYKQLASEYRAAAYQRLADMQRLQNCISHLVEMHPEIRQTAVDFLRPVVRTYTRADGTTFSVRVG